jgi:aspartate/methionine/tyrosine aminotransferase
VRRLPLSYRELEHDPRHRLPAARHSETFTWSRPTASPIGFPRISGVRDVDALCERLARTGVLLLPGSVYDQPAHVRIGFGRANMPEALELLEQNLAIASTATA